MDRLTKRIGKDAVHFDCNGTCGTCDGCTCFEIGGMVDRLAAYEDTGMEPEEIKAKSAWADDVCKTLADITGSKGVIDLTRLRELAEADRDGRCVILPCKVGDTTATLIFYDGTEQFKTEGWVAEYIKVEEDDTVIHFHCFSTDDDEDRSISEIGKTVFIHSESAEAALEAQR